MAVAVENLKSRNSTESSDISVAVVNKMLEERYFRENKKFRENALKAQGTAMQFIHFTDSKILFTHSKSFDVKIGTVSCNLHLLQVTVQSPSRQVH